jgi:hypothetical protein
MEAVKVNEEGKKVELSYEEKLNIASTIYPRKKRREYCRRNKLDWKDVGKDSKEMNEEKLKDLPKVVFEGFKEWAKKKAEIQKKEKQKLSKDSIHNEISVIEPIGV